MNDLLTFGEWLKRKRGGLGLTQKRLAHQIGYAEVTLRKVEADEIRPSQQMVDMLAQALGVAEDERAEFVRFARSGFNDGPPARRVPAVPALPTKQPAEPERQPAAAADEYALIGRDGPLQALRAEWARAAQHELRMLFITGEAGIGKTRLAEELLLQVHRQGHAAVRARSYALEGRLPYGPLADWLRSLPLQAQFAKLDRVWLSELARLLPEIRITRPELPEPELLPDRWQQKRLFEALRQAFTSDFANDGHPLLLLLDDLQWCDPETLAWLQYLAESAPQARLLVIGTVRNDEIQEDHPLRKLQRILLRAGRLTSVDLAPLNVEESAALGAEVAKGALDSGAANRLYDATGGNPLYIVETMRGGAQFARTYEVRRAHTSRTAAGKLHAAVPPKIYAVIEARLALLSATARELAQVAAIIGRAFSLALVVETSQQDEPVVVTGLDELWQRRIIREQGSSRYDFTHDRIRDVALDEISPIKCEYLHRQVAHALEKLYSADLDSLAGEVATHFQHAGDWGKAFAYFCRAAAVAKGLYAHQDAVDNYTNAIAAAQHLPQGADTAAAEMELWYELGQALVRVHDWSNERAEAAWRKADAMAEQAGDLPFRCRVLGPLAIVARYRGEWQKARELNEMLLAVVDKTGDPLLADLETSELGVTLHHMGEYADALTCFRRHPAYSPAPLQLTFSGSAADMPMSPGVFLRAAMCLWALGYGDQALACGRHLLTIRHHHIDLWGRFPALMFASMLFTMLQDAPTVLMLSEELVAISIKYDFPAFSAVGDIFGGWARAQAGAVEEGLALVRRGVDAERQRGVRMLEPFYRSLLAETLGMAGEWEEALYENTEALRYADECGNRFWNGQLLKQQGDCGQALALSGGDVEVAYQCAITTAQGQGAKMLELRAVTSLCRLWQQQGKRAAARTRLMAIYASFTEGFGLPDLQAAQAMADERLLS